MFPECHCARCREPLVMIEVLFLSALFHIEILYIYVVHQ